MPKPSHGSEPEPHSHSWDVRWFVLEPLGQEECHVTLRMLILTSKLLKEPSNRTIDVFPYFQGFFIYLLIFSYVFLLGNWYGKWTAIDLYLASWIRNLSVSLESVHWRLCNPLGLLSWFFYNSMWFLGILNCEGVLPEFCITDIDVFILYCTEVLCAAFF